jgi:hypothetical protein
MRLVIGALMRFQALCEPRQLCCFCPGTSMHQCAMRLPKYDEVRAMALRADVQRAR